MRGVSKDGRRRLWLILRGSPRCGEHLRMTAEYFARSPLREHDGGVRRYAAVTTIASPSGASTTFNPQACASSRV